MRFCVRAVLSLMCFASPSLGQADVFPARASNAPTGSEFVRQIESLGFNAREEAIYAQIISGNVPNFLRAFCPVEITNSTPGKTNHVTIFVAPDYLAVGSDADYFQTPMSPNAAQRLADGLGCALPTRKMADAIWQAAVVKLAPAPMTPGANMVTVRQFAEHNLIVHTQRQAELKSVPLGALVAGDKKDVVVTPRLGELTNRVAIYGWHRTNGQPIQPLYLGHTASWVDYSHGIRLVRQEALVNGKTNTLARILADPELSTLLSDEGVIAGAGYDSALRPAIPLQLAALIEPGSPKAAPSWADFKPTGSFGERAATFAVDPEVRVVVNVPADGEFSLGRPVRLIIYALPNGNTIEQTIGRKLHPGDDWHFNIQHIGAQTRWLRQRLTNEVLVVAYLEAAMKSWPAWRQKHGDKSLPAIVGDLKGIFVTNQVEVVLTGHSGGGSFTFGYMNALDRIPDYVTRVAFLDSNYGYRTTNHLDKLVSWLQSSRRHTLCVLAYQDYLGLLDGKSFVSEQGGTWGRSQEMLRDFAAYFTFTKSAMSDGLTCVRALNGRVSFLLKENPERKIFHTVQVEQNGFIHSQVAGTELEGSGYEYFGARVYEQLIN